MNEEYCIYLNKFGRQIWVLDVVTTAQKYNDECQNMLDTGVAQNLWHIPKAKNVSFSSLTGYNNELMWEKKHFSFSVKRQGIKILTELQRAGNRRYPPNNNQAGKTMSWAALLGVARLHCRKLLFNDINVSGMFNCTKL